MLKITKGLKPATAEGIMTYIDDEGNEYVRVKIYDEDFCIAARDYIEAGRDGLTWPEVNYLSKNNISHTFTKKQAALCAAYQAEINDKLKEIGGVVLTQDFYWTSTEYDTSCAWDYDGYNGGIYTTGKSHQYRVRPILNLK